MKKIFIFSLIIIQGIFSGCDKTLEELNVNPNDPLDAGGEQLVMGTQLANVSINVSHLQRISGMWSGQYEGRTLLYLSLHQYNMSSEETNSTWGFIYQGVLKQSRVAQSKLTGDSDSEKFQRAIVKIMEALAVGTAAELFGDVPYREAGQFPAIENPEFDPQAQVFADLQLLLDDAISELSTVSTSPSLNSAILASSPIAWEEAAHTLKARFYMDVKNYASAYTQAQMGISNSSRSLKYTPPAEGAVQGGNANLLFTFIRERGGYMRSTNTYLADMLGTGANTRRNAKTSEDARSKYYAFSGSGVPSSGVAAPSNPMGIITFEENTLILAEAGARSQNFATGLGHLNDLRAHLASGNAFIKVGAGDVLQYDAYVATDFDPGEIENPDSSLTPARALLREIIEERYVSGAGSMMPFNDARRLRKSDTDVDVNFPLNFGTVYPERMLLAQEEANSNSNAPSPIPDIFQVTPVNQ